MTNWLRLVSPDTGSTLINKPAKAARNTGKARFRTAEETIFASIIIIPRGFVASIDLSCFLRKTGKREDFDTDQSPLPAAKWQNPNNFRPDLGQSSTLPSFWGILPSIELLVK